MWLGGNTRLAPEAARWAQDSFDLSTPAVIGVDDPYTPSAPREEVWGPFLAEVSESLQTDDRDRVPVLVCCGPTEQAELLKRDFPDEFEVEIVELEREPPGELEHLRAWYRQRTGSDAPGISGENVLLVQLFFEWRTGQPLASFAQRFRRRIEAIDQDGVIFALLAEILALNRLYVGFPHAEASKRLTNRQADLLARLREDEHLVVTEDAGRSGLWLAHPHLSNGIYEAWFPPNASPNERSGHFREAALACLRQGIELAERMGPVRAVTLGVTEEAADIHNRADLAFVASVPELYDEARKLRPSFSINELVPWIEVQAAADLRLNPDPATEALAHLTTGRGPGLGPASTARLCLTLLESYDHLNREAQIELMVAVTDILRKHPEWRAWPRISAAALHADPIEELSDVVFDWLEAAPGLDLASWPLVAAIENADDIRFQSRALDLLQADPDSRAWGRVWSALWKRAVDDSLPLAGELRRLALERLQSSPHHPSWAYVWSDIGSDPLDETVEKLGVEWLGRNPHDDGWSIVWLALWQRDRSHDLEHLARRWLVGTDEVQPGFSSVWAELWSAGEQDDVLRRTGTEVLDRINLDHPAWNRIFPALCGADVKTRDLGCRWVRSASPSHQAWGFVLPALWQVGLKSDDSRLLDELEPRALYFLRTAPRTHRGWAQVFSVVWKRHPTDELRKLGRDRLVHIPSVYPGFPKIWGKLWEDRADPGLAKWAEEWLPGACQHHGWPFVWSSLAADANPSDAYFKMGEEWLMDTSTDRRGWTHVFRGIWARRPSPGLRARGLEWLKNDDGAHPGWDFVWQALWESAGDSGDRDDIRARGLAWLGSREDHDQWPAVWQRLWSWEPGNELRDLGNRWVGGIGRDHARRHHVLDRLKPKQKVNPGADTAEETAWTRKANGLRITLEQQGWNGDTSAARKSVLDGPPSDSLGEQIAWKNLWRAVWWREKSPILRDIAIAWLEAPSPTDSRGTSYVWSDLWAESQSDRLYEIGRSYLETAPISRSRWSDIWISLWDFEQLPSLILLGHDWLHTGPIDHKNKNAIRLRLAEAAKDSKIRKGPESIDSGRNAEIT